MQFRGQPNLSDILQEPSTLFLFQIGLSLGPGTFPTGLTSQLAQSIWLSLLLCAGITRVCYNSSFFRWCWGSNSGRYAHMTSNLPTELSTLLFQNPHCVGFFHQTHHFFITTWWPQHQDQQLYTFPNNGRKQAPFSGFLLRMERYFLHIPLVRIILPSISDHMLIESQQMKTVDHIQL